MYCFNEYCDCKLNKIDLNKRSKIYKCIKLNKYMCDIIESYLTKFIFEGKNFRSISHINFYFDSIGIIHSGVKKVENHYFIYLFNKNINGEKKHIFSYVI